MIGRMETSPPAGQEWAHSQVARRLPLAGGPPALVTEEEERAITCVIMALLRERMARGPAEARTVVSQDRAIVMLRDCLSIEEKRLATRGHGAFVMRTRAALYEAIGDDATAAVEAITHRRVAAYLTDQAHEPDLTVMAFVLRPSPVRLAA
jgi:uncharacterized protein YbcI